MFEKEKEKNVVLGMKKLFNEIFFARFNERTDRLVSFLDAWAPNVLIEEEKELVIRNFDEMIFAINAAKEKITLIEAPTPEETKEHVENKLKD